MKAIVFSVLLSLGSVVASETENVPTPPSTESELTQEVALRDSVMQVQGEACRIEKDSLRAVIETEKAKSANWEQSYNTVKRNNEVCAQALGVSIGVNENRKEQEEEERRTASMMATSSFLGGIGIGLLIMWLIMK